MTDDATLLQRYARDRSEAAFGELVQRHLTLVYSAALRRTDGDAHRARDVAQIVFTALARDAVRLVRHAALTGWLYAATRNAAIDGDPVNRGSLPLKLGGRGTFPVAETSVEFASGAGSMTPPPPVVHRS
jgi:hypothetical protein